MDRSVFIGPDEFLGDTVRWESWSFQGQIHFLMTSHHYYVFVKIEFVLFEPLDNHQIQHEMNNAFDIPGWQRDSDG